MAESKRALELEPLQPGVGIHLGWHYLYARQYDQAIEQFRKTLELDPAFPAGPALCGLGVLAEGNASRGYRGFTSGTAVRSGATRRSRASWDMPWRVAGRRAEALAMLEGLRQLSVDPVRVTVLGRPGPRRAG